MFTNNYIAFRHNLFFGVLSGGVTSDGIKGKYIKSAGGTTVEIWGSMQMSDLEDIGSALYLPMCRAIVTDAASSKYNTYYGVYFGSGSTPATKADYTLESPIASGLTINSKKTLCLDKGNGQYVVLGQYVLTNTTEAEINIYEMGVFLPIEHDQYSTWYPVMMDRTVLTEPITVPAGGTKAVEYRFTFNQTLNVE